MRATTRTIMAIACLAFSFGCGSDASAESPATNKAPHAERHGSALASAKAILTRKADQATSSDWVRLGDAQLRSGHVTGAVNSFEKAIALSPQLRPHLWQYGIALFFAERYADGRDLFVEHRKVNPNDVENAAWHFLCAAKTSDVAEARKILLPAPNDPRPPMNEILRRLSGGNSDAMEAAVQRSRGGTTKIMARFYADLYLGLIADAEGNDKQSAATFLQAAGNAPLENYMADVARVYATQLVHRVSVD